ncbi:MAG: antitoxin [Deltaproteobacteria bacterium]|nr:antitoxin [Deltaproteobacteria bacterium]
MKAKKKAQLTVRQVDGELLQALRRETRRRGESLNKVTLSLLRGSLGIGSPRTLRRYTDLDHLAGRWSLEERAEFDERLGEHREIDADLWK